MSPRPTRLLAALLLTASLTAATACSGSDEGAAPTTAAEEGDAAEAQAVSAAPAGEVATAEPVPSSGCGSTTVGSVVDEKQYLDDSQRWFLLSTPLDHDGDTPVPLVFDFHGLGEGAEVHSMMSAMGPYGDEHGFAVVMPHGEGTPVRWRVEPDLDANPDLQYVADVLDQLEAELCIDTSRVYATGLSNGAFMSSVIACTMSDRFVAVAPVAGVIRPEGCEPSRPVPMLGFHGTDDAILLFNGGVGERLGEVLAGAERGEVPASEVAALLPEADLEGEGYPANVRRWAADNGCEPTPDDDDLTPTVLLRTYDCPPDAAVEFAVVEGGGHSWPGSEFSQAVASAVGPTDTSVLANDLIWAFFQRFALPAT